MNRYEGYVCPACGQTFTAEDDVVVCPVCGTPHHRDCWTENGCCVNKSKHAEGYGWQPENKIDDNTEKEAQEREEAETPRPAPRKLIENGGSVECPHCHGETQANMPFCLKCGASLMEENQSLCLRCGNLNDKSASFCSRCGMVLPQGQTFNVPQKEGKTYIRPLDEIDGVTVAEISTCVQVNNGRYIPKFFKMSAGKKKLSWNWASFFLSPYWFFFRKMYAAGAVMVCIMLALNLIFMPQIQPAMEAYAQFADVATAAASTSADIAAAQEKLMPEMQKAMPSMYAYMGIQAVLRVLCGLFSDELYRRQIMRNIKQWRKENDPAAYQIRLLRNGGVSPMFAAASVFILPALVNVCVMLLELF